MNKIALLALVSFNVANIFAAVAAQPKADMGQLVEAIDQRVEKYETAPDSKDDKEYKVLLNDVIKDIETYSKIKKLEFGDVALTVGKVFNKRAVYAVERAKKSKGPKLTVEHIKNVSQLIHDQAVMQVVRHAYIEYYVFTPLDESTSDQG